ncbi:hypothetical protein PC116_g14087 [Phytophthora cactorum]|uniref:Uncharacterized protein n=1 Tax=Phytophthora cactorum TaxID=29920 RepID=A0A8T1DLY6_9STRA|nr:hypothetical protein Pcac1_g5803 [Phytophthora cactorum]KAG2906003.1 hypothetical protein PC114_g11336 [Phytophthora cactorum]KAG2939982.1 hypothetical protein PC117_g10719 [Phytophthora cactorum]KAG3018852.1 hypothetical protein PC119_g10510 [Phytophthora cactorum]KAG3020645.1 hypothetical protein PC120_g9182 [Phytophthora cactorum]
MVRVLGSLWNSGYHRESGEYAQVKQEKREDVVADWIDDDAAE